MIDMDTFLLILYVMVDDFCKAQLPTEKRPGPKASLSRSEVITLAIFGQWYRFRGQRDFYRYAQKELRSAFPTLPYRSQTNTSEPPTSTPLPTDTPIPPTDTPIPPTNTPPPPTDTAAPAPTSSPPTDTEPLPTPTEEPAPTQPPAPKVVIAYIFYDRVVKRVESDEYAEIRNDGGSPVNLAGWRLNAGDPGQDFVFPDYVLGPGQSCRVYTNEHHPNSGGFSFGSGQALWNNKGECGFLMANIPRLGIAQDAFRPALLRRILDSREKPEIDGRRKAFQTKVDEYTARLRAAQDPERQLIAQEFEHELSANLKLLKRDLQRAGLETLISKEGIVAVLLGLVAGTVQLGLGIAIGLAGEAVTYRKKRQDALNKHWSSWIFSTTAPRFALW